MVCLMDVPFEKATATVYRNPHVVLMHASRVYKEVTNPREKEDAEWHFD